MNKSKIKSIITICIFVIGIFFGSSKIDWQNLNVEEFEEILYEAEKILVSNDIEYEETNYKNKITTSLNNSNFDIFVFDVGQADSIFITSNGENLLIDAGNNPDGELIVEQLKSMNISTIDYLIGTHTHEDHIGGIDDIIKNFEIKNLYMPSNEYDSSTYRDIKTAAKSKKITKTAPKVGHKFALGEAMCEIMAIDSTNEDINLTSIVVEVTHGENKFLFMADAEIENEEKRLWNDVDVLKVGHHGSSTSTSEDFLEQIKPEIAVISLGKNNEYGHPHKETINALNDYEVKIHRTDKEGTIHIQSNGEEYQIEALDIHLDGNK